MSAAEFPLTEAQLTGNWFETLTYGMYFVTCGFCARTLLFIGPEQRWRKPSEIRWFILSVAVVLFVVGTFDVVIGLLHNLQAFVFFRGTGGAAQELTDISNWINIARSVAQVIQMILGDFVLIYRCYIVHARRFKVVIPSFFLYLVGVAMAIKLIEVEASLNHAKITLNSSEILPWWITFFCVTAVQNTLTTSLLIWRIWRVEHESDKFRFTRSRTVSIVNAQPRLRKVIRVIAESGFAYTMMVFMTFVTLQATGIAFNVIIVRSSPRRDEEFTTFDTNSRAVVEEGRVSHLHVVAHTPNRSGLTTTIDDGHITLKSLGGQTASTQLESIYNIDNKDRDAPETELGSNTASRNNLGAS
ncbi:hypothetical protein GGX14DRAFT_569155 [Mycena pura]|uniref:Uncharacterized protein n=1 Tax=Mycena pura TaxID=153505 RepID=A0AAD6Y8B1_9AGAR|nr:hypothetical protein GGX14DRAFT_569155 [Mycena pura]